MVIFTAMNLAGAKFLSDSNIIVVVWKTAVPFLAVGVVAALQFIPENFHAGGGFLPFGFHGVFAALTGGVVFALQGFEQAVQLAGEARNPKRDLSRAILTAMAIGAVLYALLQIVMIGALEPANIVKGWSQPLGTDPSDYGAWYTLALALGVGWLANVLLVDAVISPAGTGVVYVATSARLSYALGEEREMPASLARTNKDGVPVVSILVAAVVGTLAFGPFKSWNALVSVVTAATAIMYAFAPVSLAALHRVDGGRPRSYRVPVPGVDAPRRVLLRQSDHVLGRVRDDLEADACDGSRPRAVRDRCQPCQNRSATLVEKRHLDRTLARRPRAHRRPGPVRRRQQSSAELV